MAQNWQIIVNSRSNGGKTAKNWQKLAQKHAITYPTHFTKSVEELQNLVAHLAQNNETNLISVGGDGSLNVLLNAVFNQNILPVNRFTLAALPCGTGNDWLRTHFLGAQFSEILTAIAQNKQVAHSIGKLTDEVGNSRYFLNVAGFGFDAYTVQKLNFFRLKGLSGLPSYVIALIASLFGYKTQHCTLDFNGTARQVALFNLNVGCCRYAGGGMMLLPKACPTNNYFDLTLVNDISKLKVLVKIPLLFSGNFTKEKEIEQHETKALKITAPQPMMAQTDGELMPLSKQFFIEIMPNAIGLISSLGKG